MHLTFNCTSRLSTTPETDSGSTGASGVADSVWDVKLACWKDTYAVLQAVAPWDEETLQQGLHRFNWLRVLLIGVTS